MDSWLDGQNSIKQERFSVRLHTVECPFECPSLHCRLTVSNNEVSSSDQCVQSVDCGSESRF